MHPDTLRKAAAGVRMVAEAGMLAGSDDQTDYEKVYEAKKQFYDQRREFNTLLVREAREEHLMNTLRDAAMHIGNEYPLLPKCIEPDETRKDEAVLVLTDWHYGMVSDNIWNEYNTEICRQRLGVLRDKVIERLLLHKVNVLHVFVLGDMANGAIHVTSRVSAEEKVVEQLMHVSELIAQFVSEMSNYVSDVKIYCTYGNHMRTVQNKHDSIHADNMERIIPWWLKERLRGCDRIEVCDTGRDEIIRAVVNGAEVCGVHGDLDGGKDAMLVIGQLYERAYGAKMKYMFYGHLHSVDIKENYGITSIRAGGLCGTDEFAKNARLFSEPCQTLAIFSCGEIDALYNISVGGKGG